MMVVLTEDEAVLTVAKADGVLIRQRARDRAKIWRKR